MPKGKIRDYRALAEAFRVVTVSLQGFAFDFAAAAATAARATRSSLRTLAVADAFGAVYEQVVVGSLCRQTRKRDSA